MAIYFSLEKIIEKHLDIKIKNNDGSLRNVVDVLEDFYLSADAKKMSAMFYEIAEEERDSNVFNKCRNREYKGVE